MPDREKVIALLERYVDIPNLAGVENYGAKIVDMPAPLVADTLALLKAQEARVMTLEEIPDAVFGWMEMFGQIIPCVLEDVYADDTVGFANIEDGHDYMCASDYGKTWRVWTSCPDEKRRAETPWN